MGPLFMLVAVFVVAYVLFYISMRVSCFVKRKYCQGEGALCRFMLMFMCEECKKACESHLKLLLRAGLFAAIVAVTVTAIVHFVR